MKYFLLFLLLVLTHTDDLTKEEEKPKQNPQQKPDESKNCDIPQTYMSYYGCQVYAGECSWGYTYYVCRKQYCSQYYTQKNKDGTTTTYCIQYSYMYYTQPNCLYQCCGDVGRENKKFTPEVLQQCKEENSERTKRFWLIVLGIFGVIATVAFCAWICENIKRKRRQFMY